jgi:hypothetical protein
LDEPRTRWWKTGLDLHGMEPGEVALIEMSPVISCASGDRIVGQDVAERSVFVVLDGAVEVLRRQVGGADDAVRCSARSRSCSASTAPLT